MATWHRTRPRYRVQAPTRALATWPTRHHDTAETPHRHAHRTTARPSWICICTRWICVCTRPSHDSEAERGSVLRTRGFRCRGQVCVWGGGSVLHHRAVTGVRQRLPHALCLTEACTRRTQRAAVSCHAVPCCGLCAGTSAAARVVHGSIPSSHAHDAYDAYASVCGDRTRRLPTPTLYLVLFNLHQTGPRTSCDNSLLKAGLQPSQVSAGSCTLERLVMTTVMC